MPAYGMRLSIRNQIVVLVSALLLAAMGSFLALAIHLFNSNKLDYLHDSNTQLARTLAEQVHSSLQHAMEELLSFDAQQAEQATQLALSRLPDDPDILGVESWRKVGPNFALAYHHEFVERLGSPAVGLEILQEARRKTPMDPSLLETEGIVLRNASLPGLPLLRLWMRSRDGARVVVADISPRRLLPTFSPAAQHSQIYLVDPRGTVLAHRDEALVVARADRSRAGAVRHALKALAPGEAPEVEAPEESRLGAHATVRGTRLSVIVELAGEEATRAAWELTQTSALAALPVLLAALAASFFLARRLAEPLQRLQEKMESVARGDFGVQVEVPKGKELGTLAIAFNRMSRELGERELALLEANQQLIQSEKLSTLGEMSAGLAHEVKNPMVGICGFSELGGYVETLEEAREYFALINADAHRANEILQHLLAFARPEQMELVSLDVNDVVRGAVRLIAHQVQINGVRLATSYAGGLPPVMGSSNHLRQVLINLSMNAAHAMAQSPEKVLTVSTALVEDGRVQITVKDTGKGMDEEVQRKIFRPFFTTKPTGLGTGLGLSVSKAIIQQHKGEISVTSAPGQGATFTILLPAVTPAPRIEADDEVTGI